MLKSVVIAVFLISTASAMTYYNIGYSGAGKDYIKKVRNERKSVRAGSGYYVPFMSGSKSFRRGK